MEIFVPNQPISTIKNEEEERKEYGDRDYSIPFVNLLDAKDAKDGIVLKNSLDAKDAVRKEQLIQQWVAIDASVNSVLTAVV
ncbi:hypothetical protein IFM89_032617 [Coptis chinensis]|uniref:Uncharacterized protein n=1 Tax=Coptis chinensis TaxID=261450 RepID=A0A835IRD2_9MAGN|nr:hypothetical protein IFM89_032617 [Coptis chinensis]